MPMPQTYFNRSICSHEDFGESNGITDFVLNDTSRAFQAIPSTIDWRRNISWMCSLSKIEDTTENIQFGPQQVKVFDNKDDKICIGNDEHRD